MSLFQPSVSSKYLKTLDKQAVLAAYTKFKAHFHNPAIQENIRNSKEEQYQGEFLIDLFVNVLGYTKHPSAEYNLTTEYKNVKDSKKADGAILSAQTMGHAPLSSAPLSSTPLPKKIVAVIELKGTNTTDLGHVEAQAFGYKNNQPECVYVITSNFEKLRFYIDNAIEFLEFNLFTLTEKDFELLYLCLAYSQIEKGIPKKIKDESISHEDDITKQLYRDYSLFKRELHADLVAKNPEYDTLVLFRKSQKLLSRFLFLFFAEDRELLPPNSVRLILNQWQQLRELDEYSPLYSRFKKYFGYLNTGYKGKQHDVFAYNGGLFKPDAILDSVQIDDDLLYRHTAKISDYDFASEVDVNILGHIFENSLNELDELKAEIAGEVIDKSKTKRKKDGVFYTPKYITKYIVDNTVGRLCEEKKAEIGITTGHAPLMESGHAITTTTRGHAPTTTRGHAPTTTRGHAPLQKKTKQALSDKLAQYREWLLQISICDPACGSGAFLNQALNFLIDEHRYIDELQAKLFGDALVLSNIENTILENNLFGVDLNEESVEIARLSLWLRTAQPNRKLNDLSRNIKCGNSLIDDPAVAGEKAFDWEREFPQVFVQKQKIAWHITTATHNSRYSQRMFDNYVKLGEPVWLSEVEELIVSKTIAEIAVKDNLNILAYNICGDHMHLLLACEKEEVDKIVGKLKSMSARACNIAMGRTIPIPTPTPGTTRGHAHLSTTDTIETSGHAHLLEKHAPLSTETGSVPAHGETQTQLWTQKFGKKEITSDEQLYNTIQYIENNRVKHGLPELSCDGDAQNKGASPLVIAPISEATVSSIPIVFPQTVSPQHAFRPEYKGGFDVVIGNPPYGATFSENHKNYFIGKFKISPTILDTYLLFILHSMSLIEENGFLGFIIPSTWLYMTQFSDFRVKLVKNYELSEIRLFRNAIFEEATVETCIALLKNNSPLADSLYNYKEINGLEILNDISVTQKSILNDTNVSLLLKNISIDKLYQKISENNSLDKFTKIICGLTPYRLGKGNPKQTQDIVENRLFDSNFKKDETYRQYLMGRDFNRYIWQIEQERWISYGDWLAEPRYAAPFDVPQKIILRQTSDRIIAHLDTNKYVSLKNVHNLEIVNSEIDYKFLLSVLNSKLLDWWYQQLIPEKGRVFAEVKVINLKKLPIKIAPDQQPFIAKANQMLSLNKELQEATAKFQRSLVREFSLESLSSKLQNWHTLSYAEFIKELDKLKVKLSLHQKAEWESYFRQEADNARTIKTQIDSTDREIDRMVYELYGLTEEEIGIVENS